LAWGFAIIGAALFGSQAGAQPWGTYAGVVPGGGYGFYGYGAPGYGFGYGVPGASAWGSGMSPRDVLMLRQWIATQALAQWELERAQTASALQMARASQAEALQNRQDSLSRIQQKRDADAARASAARKAELDRMADLLDESGKLRWPESSPLGLLEFRRNALDQAVKAALEEYRQRGESTEVSTRDARRRLYRYGDAALAVLKDKPERPAMVEFLNRLDRLILALGNEDLKAPAPPQ
jgi:hypothetical protein